jgi:hypothetical protein
MKVTTTEVKLHFYKLTIYYKISNMFRLLVMFRLVQAIMRLLFSALHIAWQVYIQISGKGFPMHGAYKSMWGWGITPLIFYLGAG